VLTDICLSVNHAHAHERAFKKQVSDERERAESKEYT